ncbi:G-protein coupled receptor 35-like [Xyrichtys novacula]|nr:G-protein coupled receptor 35-like [Xyrichtys novacula]
MGNSSTASSAPSAPSAPPCTLNCSISSNVSVGGASSSFLFPSPGGNLSFLLWFLDFSGAGLTRIVNRCHVQGGSLGWLGVKIFILVTAFPANAALMMTLLNRRRSMTPSELLGLNVSVMDVLYCLCLPLDLYTTLHHSPDSAQEALFALNVLGCPLLLTCMCLERYVAAAWPMIYIRMGRWEYRVVLCACTWVLTLTAALLGYFLGLFSVLLGLSVIISLLFLLMLLSLLGIVRVLRQSGPGDASGSGVPLKRRALKNVLAVMAPSVVAYSPLVALVPYMAVITSQHSDAVSPAQCDVLQVLLLFPNFGLFIGPTFYLSRLRQVSCWARNRKEQNDRTQTE